MAHFVSNFVGNGDQSGVNINDIVKLADPKNHTP